MTRGSPFWAEPAFQPIPDPRAVFHELPPAAAAVIIDDKTRGETAQEIAPDGDHGRLRGPLHFGGYRPVEALRHPTRIHLENGLAAGLVEADITRVGRLVRRLPDALSVR